MPEKINLDLYEEALLILQTRIGQMAAAELLRALLDGTLKATGMCKWKFSNRADLYQRPYRRSIPRDEWRLPNRLAGSSVFDLERRTPRHRLYCGGTGWLNGTPWDFGDVVQSIQVHAEDIDRLWSENETGVESRVPARLELNRVKVMPWMRRQFTELVNVGARFERRTEAVDALLKKFAEGYSNKPHQDSVGRAIAKEWQEYCAKYDIRPHAKRQ